MYDEEVPVILLNDRMNNVEVHVVVPKKKTVALKKNTLGSKKKTCDVEVPDSARKLAFGVVSDAEVPGVLSNEKRDNAYVPVVVLKKRTVGGKNNIFDVGTWCGDS